jgi:hypothetical protein
MVKLINMKQSDLLRLSEDLSKLKNFQSSTFNLFRILKIGHKEIYHSNFLAWLFDFKYNPDIAPLLLNKLMIKIFDNSIKLNASNNQPCYFNKDSSQVVYREKNHIDLIIEFPNDKRVLVFENKIYAKESKGQLNRYRKLMDEYYSKISEEFKITYIFLTLNNETPSDSNWQSVGFDTILDILISIKKELTGHHKLLDYIQLLEEDLMGKESNEKRDFALKIINKFSEELKYLFELSDNKSEVQGVLKNNKKFSKKDNLSLTSTIIDLLISNKFNNEIQIIRTSKTYINFFTKTIHDITGDYGTGEWLGKSNKYWISFEFNSKNSNDFRLILVIGPTKGRLNQRLTEFLMNNANFEGKTLFTKNNNIINDYYNSVNIFKCPIPSNSSADEIKTIINNQLRSFFNDNLKTFNRYFQYHSRKIKDLVESID